MHNICLLWLSASSDCLLIVVFSCTTYSIFKKSMSFVLILNCYWDHFLKFLFWCLRRVLVSKNCWIVIIELAYYASRKTAGRTLHHSKPLGNPPTRAVNQNHTQVLLKQIVWQSDVDVASLPTTITWKLILTPLQLNLSVSVKNIYGLRQTGDTRVCKQVRHSQWQWVQN